jgi:hypothetical protein
MKTFMKHRLSALAAVASLTAGIITAIPNAQAAECTKMPTLTGATTVNDSGFVNTEDLRMQASVPGATYAGDTQSVQLAVAQTLHGGTMIAVVTSDNLLVLGKAAPLDLDVDSENAGGHLQQTVSTTEDPVSLLDAQAQDAVQAFVTTGDKLGSDVLTL